jgi:hypothetical protein
LSVGCVVLVGAVVVVVDLFDLEDLEDLEDFDDLEDFVVVVVAAAVVVVVAAGAVVVVAAGAVVVVVVVGTTKGFVSPLAEAWLMVGVADKLVQLRAASQFCSAVAAGVPDRGCGSPATMVAGRNVAETMCRPTAVTRSDPLSVSGAVSS